MADIPADGAPGTWSAPQCPFTIEYVRGVLDDIRLAVMDAFFSLPRGGVEIGGLLLGRREKARVIIEDHVVLACEHASGPSFVLSANDEAHLRELLEKMKQGPGRAPVGWYHSHTRSEILLSEADQDIHRRFFPESWQVALVLKPHTFQPMRCGFFFREADGSIHATESWHEFTLEALPLRQMPTGEVPPMESRRPAGHVPGEGGTLIEVSAEAPASSEIRTTEPEPAPTPPMAVPAFAEAVPPRPRSWAKVLLAFGLGVGVGAGGFEARRVWLEKAAPVTESRGLDLTAVDTDGQLQIRWDRSAPVVQRGTAAVLTITDGGPAPREIHLDADHLRSGSFTYGRESARVDVGLVITRKDASSVRGATTFAGKAPAPVGNGSDSDVQIAKLKSDLATQVEQVRKVERLLADQSLLVSQATKMKENLAAANSRIQKLEKDLAEARNEIRQQQRKRLGAQDAGK